MISLFIFDRNRYRLAISETMHYSISFVWENNVVFDGLFLKAVKV